MLADCAVCRIECLSGKSAALRILCTEELGFHTVTDDVKVAAETFECTGMVTVTGAGAFESTTDRNDTHGEVTTAGIWHTFEHILYFAAAVSGTIGGKVYFEVAYRFKGPLRMKGFSADWTIWRSSSTVLLPAGGVMFFRKGQACLRQYP